MSQTPSERLASILDEMIRRLDKTTNPHEVLHTIGGLDDEVAALIESTGLADHVELPSQLRPAFQTNYYEPDEDGIVTSGVYCFRCPGPCYIAHFDVYALSKKLSKGKTTLQAVSDGDIPWDGPIAERESEYGFPDTHFFTDLRECLERWRWENQQFMASSGAVAGVKKHDGGSEGTAGDNGLTPAELCGKVGISDETLRKARNKAGINGPSRGQHSFRYAPDQFLPLANARNEVGFKGEEKEKWATLLEQNGQPPIGSKPKAKPKRNPK